MKSPGGFLMIEPERAPSKEPVLDTITRRVAAALSKVTENPRGHYKGHHTCICGVASGSIDLFLDGSGLLTNSLAVHYVAYHRDEIPPEEMAKIKLLPDEELAPKEWELAAPLIDPEELERRIQQALEARRYKPEAGRAMLGYKPPPFFDIGTVNTPADRLIPRDPKGTKGT